MSDALAADPQFGGDLERPVQQGGGAFGRHVSGKGAVAGADQLGDLGLEGDEQGGEPAIDEVGRPRHLHVEARKQANRRLGIGPLIVDHPLVDREDAQRPAVPGLVRYGSVAPI